MSNTIPVYGATGSTGVTTTTAPLSVNLPNPNGGGSSTPVTTTTTGGAGTSGNFAGASNADPQQASLDAIVKELQGITPAQFFATYKITNSTQQQIYLSSTGALNENAVYLAYYKQANRQEKQSLQEQMVSAGLIAPADANGFDNSTALGAFQSLLGQTSIQHINPLQYLGQQSLSSSGTNAIQNTISSDLTAAQKNLSAPLAITETNPTTLAATLTNAFDQALGYAPDQKQIQSFIDQIQGQESSYGSAPRAEAQAQIDQAHAQESALNKLGPNGIDSVISAYQAAITGTKLPGAGTVQGPVNGSVPNPSTPLPAGTPSPGSPTGDSKFTYQNGALTGANVPATPNGSAPQAVQPGLWGQIEDIFKPGGIQNTINGGNVNEQTKMVPSSTPYQGTMPFAPSNLAGSHNTHGGLYALSPQDWAEAQKLIPTIVKNYPTAGQAPVNVQHAAMTALLQNQYDTNGGSWSKAISSIASGSPFGTAEGTHLTSFGNQVAAEVNNQITALQSQVNNQAVTVKVTQPDAAAEASAAAKGADPVGYYAANSASWGNELNQMLTGAPLMYSQSTSDTFSGPVPTSVAGTASSSGVVPSVASTGVK